MKNRAQQVMKIHEKWSLGRPRVGKNEEKTGTNKDQKTDRKKPEKGANTESKREPKARNISNKKHPKKGPEKHARNKKKR